MGLVDVVGAVLVAETEVVVVERRERDNTKKFEFTAEMIKLDKLKCGVEIITRTKRLESELQNKPVDVALSSLF